MVDERHTPPTGLSPAAAAEAIQAAAPALVPSVLRQFLAIHPELGAGSDGQAPRLFEEISRQYVAWLVAALRLGDAGSFAGQVQDSSAALGARGVRGDHLARLLELIGQEIRETQGEGVWLQIRGLLDDALRRLQGDDDRPPLDDPRSAKILPVYLQTILAGSRLRAQDLVLDAMRSGLTLREVYLDVFQPSLYELGRMWEQGRVSVAQEHLATAITQSILAAIYANTSLLPPTDKRAVVGCLSGNFHEIGPRMLADFLQMAGYNTRFLGANTPEDSLLSMIDQTRPDVIGLPSTFQNHVEQVRRMIDQLRAEFTVYRPTIMVGGLAFNHVDGLWRQVGGDVWGPDAGQAVDHLVGSRDWTP